MIRCNVLLALFLVTPVLVLASEGADISTVSVTSMDLHPSFRHFPLELSPLEHSDRPRSAGDMWGDLRDGGTALASDIGYIYSSPFRMNRRSALWLGGIVSVGTLVFVYDQELYDMLKRNEHESPYEAIRDTGEFFEPLGFQGAINKYLIGAYAVGYVTGIDPLRDIPGEIVGSFLVSTLGKRAANAAVGRQGPKIGEGPRKFEFADGRSFPSGHSITITTIARVLTHHVPYRPFHYATYAMTGTVLLQRITSNAHWPSDVFFGAIYGWVVTDALLDRKTERSTQLYPTLLDDGRALGLAVKIVF